MVDELWAFLYCKQKNVTSEVKEKVSEAGDVWLWIAMDAETKLVPSWLLGKRDAGYAFEFINDLKNRLASRVQLTSDGHRAYGCLKVAHYRSFSCFLQTVLRL